MHESVKHLLFTRPRQIEQFGGGEWLAIWRCWSSLLFSESAAEAGGERRPCCFFKNSRIRKLVGGSPLADGPLEKSICPSGVGHSTANSAIIYFHVSFPGACVLSLYVFIVRARSVCVCNFNTINSTLCVSYVLLFCPLFCESVCFKLTSVQILCYDLYMNQTAKDREKKTHLQR